MMILRPGQRLVIPGVRVIQPRATGSAFVGVIDGISNVAAAYGLRKLRSAYSGSAVRVRRSSDNAEQDIGFASDGEFGSSAFSSFVGGGTGYVKTWYDQSGAAVDATQSTTSAQPSIVLSAVNSKAVVRLGASGGSHSLAVPSLTLGSIIALTKFNSGDAGCMLGSATTATNYAFFAIGGSLYTWSPSGSLLSYATSSYVHAIHSNVFSASAVERLNGVSKATGSQGSWTATFNIGKRSDGYNLAGDIAELIVLSSSLSATDHNTIGNDMATRYGLSWTTVT